MATQDRGFASMDSDKQKEIAKKGGQSSHNGGFASMDKTKQKDIASKGGKASGSNNQATHIGFKDRQILAVFLVTDF